MLEGRNLLARQSNNATTRDRRQRQRASKRADRMYTRQYAAETARENAGSKESSPRPALYKGEMGSKQRRSVSMQRSSEAGPVSAKIDLAGWFSNLNLTPRKLKLGTVALCFVLACLFLYTPAQQYYQAQRENGRLTAEYSVIEQRNEALDAQNDTLASNAGMEDAVRQKFGYVKQGDQVATVSGLSDRVVGTALAANNSDIEANVLSSTVKAPEEWYTPLLDAFFGYE